MRTRGILAVAAIALLGSLAACGSSSKTSPPTATTTAATTAPAQATTIDQVAAQAQITTAWTTFFNGQLKDEAAKLAVLEDADKIKATYEQSAAKNAASLAQSSAKVTAVAFLSLSDCNDALSESVACAKVTFDLLVNGKDGLPAYIGYAVLVGGSWKVSKVTECALSALGGVNCPA